MLFRSFFLVAIAAIGFANIQTADFATAQDTQPADETKTGEGQADLDDAMVKRIGASSKKELEEVAGLLESAIKKGLDDENKAFAKKMLAGINLERAKSIVGSLGRQPNPANAMAARDEALKHLDRAVKHDPSLAEAFMMIAKLSMAGNADTERAKKAADNAIKALEGEPREQSEAYMLRAMMESEEGPRLKNINKAIEANPNSIEAFQARALHFFRSEKIEKAVKDLKRVLEIDPTNSRVAETAVQALAELDRTDEALKILNDGLAAKPTASLYRLRAAFHAQEDKEDEALSDLNKAIELNSNDPAALMARAEIYLRKDEIKKSRADLDKAMALKPGSVQGVLLRAYVSAQEGRLPDAINDMKLLVSSFPENSDWANQLASFYQMDNRPRKAIDVTTDVLKREKNNWRSLRIRADSRLSTGEHGDAVKDYEKALKQKIDNEDSRAGILNNLAWVLATSPKEELRDGKRAIELGAEAAKLTKYEQAHILSTLAAGYAEDGNFEKAIEWSTKAVELGKNDGHDQLEQLEEELDSYKNKKPWREEQDIEENKAPIFAPGDIIDT